MPECLQERYAPNSVCFGCGPKNSLGLHLKSFAHGDSVEADWTPQPSHVAFGSFASGGIISVLMDCHGNWAATYSLMKSKKLTRAPGTVRAEYTVRFLKPTPIDKEWHLRAWPTKVDGRRVNVSAELTSDEVVTATMSGLFIEVKEGHPAYNRWH
jgi:acyl-coenzyme A thioesterase PaaI-like protein